jgi:hypothetical protein
MPSIQSRLTGTSGIVRDQIQPTHTAGPSSLALAGNPATLSMLGTSTNLMSANQGNQVPMRGTLPIEYMNDCDLYRFYPQTPYFDRVWSSVYSQLYNST